MHKLRLDELKVESFATEEDENTKRRGTVRAYDESVVFTVQATCLTCNPNQATCQPTCAATCYFTCPRTCDFTCPNACPH